MNFKSFFLALPGNEREDFAKTRLGSSVGYCFQLCYGTKNIELGFADVIVAATRQEVALRDLPLTERALRQDHLRRWDGTTERRKRKPA